MGGGGILTPMIKVNELPWCLMGGLDAYLVGSVFIGNCKSI